LPHGHPVGLVSMGRSGFGGGLFPACVLCTLPVSACGVGWIGPVCSQAQIQSAFAYAAAIQRLADQDRFARRHVPLVRVED